MADEKPFAPTPRRLKQARKEGKVLKCQAITSIMSCTLLVATALCTVTFFWVRNQMLLEYLLVQGWRDPILSLTVAVKILLKELITCLGLGALIGLFIEVVQKGMLFEFSLLHPKLSRFNPISGLKGCFQGLRQLWLLLLKLGVILVIFLVWLKWAIQSGSHLFLTVDSEKVLFFAKGVTLFIAYGCGACIVLGLCDYFSARRKFYCDLRMSYQEIKNEFREQEGDPHIKAARRSLHQALALEEIVHRIRKAKVVVVEKSR